MFLAQRKLYQLLNVMESVDLLRIVRFENDTNVKTAGQTRRITVAVGGSSKDRKNADFVVRDDIDYPASGALMFNQDEAQLSIRLLYFFLYRRTIIFYKLQAAGSEHKLRKLFPRLDLLDREIHVFEVMGALN